MRIGLTVSEAIGLYLVAGTLGGFVVGLLRSALRSWYGAAIVGVMAAIPGMWCTFAVLHGIAATVEASSIATILELSLIAGGPTGAATWFVYGRTKVSENG